MSSKDAILAMLEKNRGKMISGESIARQLNISRSAVCKAVKALRSDGFSIIARSNAGYTLAADNLRLSVPALIPYLDSAIHPEYIHLYPSLDSTNTRAKLMAQSGCPDGTIVIAESQTGGRGRMGRTFYSPAGSGIYMSIVLRPSLTVAQSLSITIASCALIRQSIEKVTGKSSLIKWVNDLYYNEQKICGILTEAASDFETGTIDYVVVGVGINLVQPEDGFPKELSQIAGALFEKPPHTNLRAQLTAAVINALSHLSKPIDMAVLMEDYRSHSLVIGRDVVLTQGSHQIKGCVQKIDNAGQLILKCPDSSTYTASSGEISLRLQD